VCYFLVVVRVLVLRITNCRYITGYSKLVLESLLRTRIQKQYQSGTPHSCVPNCVSSGFTTERFGDSPDDRAPHTIVIITVKQSLLPCLLVLSTICTAQVQLVMYSKDRQSRDKQYLVLSKRDREDRSGTKFMPPTWFGLVFGIRQGENT
jgi:hypothetical protein